MRLRPTPSFEKAYPDLSQFLTPQDMEDSRKFLRDEAPEIAKNFEKDIVSLDLGSRAVNALVSRGKDNHVILVAAEHATGIGIDGDLDAVMRAHAIRNRVNKDATLAYFPSNLRKGNPKLSEEDIRDLLGKKGEPANFKSFTDLMMAMLEAEGLADNDNKFTAVGNSQGASVITSLAASGDIDMHSLSTFLPPDVVERDKDQLLEAFRSEPHHFFDNIQISKLGVKEAAFFNQGITDLIGFAINARDEGNQATIGPLLTGKHEKELRQALTSNPKLAVVRGWVPKAAISPAETNAQIGERLDAEFPGQVKNYEIGGKYAGPTSANVWPISAVLARRAFIMANNPEAA